MRTASDVGQNGENESFVAVGLDAAAVAAMSLSRHVSEAKNPGVLRALTAVDEVVDVVLGGAAGGIEKERNGAISPDEEYGDSDLDEQFSAGAERSACVRSTMGQMARTSCSLLLGSDPERAARPERGRRGRRRGLGRADSRFVKSALVVLHTGLFPKLW